MVGNIDRDDERDSPQGGALVSHFKRIFFPKVTFFFFKLIYLQDEQEEA